VVEDVPALVDERRIKYPHVIFNFIKHLGAAELMPQFILQNVPN